jgi:hypothetical protein
LADDRAHRPAEQEGAELVQQRADRLHAALFGEAVVPAPEAGEHGVFTREMLGEAGAPVLVGEAGGDLGQGHARVAGEREHAGPQDVVGAWPPELLVDAAEAGDDVLGDELALGAVEDVEAERAEAALGVDHHQRLGRRVEPGEDVVDEVALGVDGDRAAAGGGVGKHELGEQGGLAAAGGTEDVQVVAGVGRGERERPGGAGVGAAERLPHARQLRWRGQ